jgi:glycosidase
MGVEILWFMPITPISFEKRQGSLGSYYACSDYTSINPEFGTLNDFKNLVEDAHDQGFKVIIDWVCNHTGYDHVWTKEHPEFYKKNNEGDFYDIYGWIDVIDLDFTNSALRIALIEAMRFWVKECDIDGFRCDMAHLVPLDFWSEARADLSKDKDLFWLAETEEAAYHAVFDASYAWEFLHKMEAMYKSETNLEGLRSVIKKNEVLFPPDALRAYFTTNHDENSHSGSEYERLGEAAKAFAVLCATLPGSIPLVYSGQELPNKKRLKFFEKDEIEWKGKYALHNFYKTLLTLRKNHPALVNGKFKQLVTTVDDKIFAFLYSSGDHQVLVMINLSFYSFLKFKLETDLIKGRYESAFSKIEIDFLPQQSFELQAWEYLIYFK